MPQEKAWNDEYKKPKLLSVKNSPQRDVVRFTRWVRKRGFKFKDSKLVDLGSGNGKNSFYFAGLGADVVGVEISDHSICIAENNSKESGLDLNYIKSSIGEVLPFSENSFDLALDIVSSNSLTEKERDIFVSEVSRILKGGGYFLTKALCKDADKNAKNLLKKFAGTEKDCYTLPAVGITERVWSREDFIDFYGKYFEIICLEKKVGFPRVNGQSYKRNFWICYMQNK